MTIGDYFRVLRERWLAIVVVTLLCAGAASAIFLLRSPVYTADLTLYVYAQTGDTPQQAYQGAQLSEQRVTSYTALVNGRRVTTETARELGLAVRPEDLAKQITATSPTDSVLIGVAVSDASPERAALIANTVGAVMTRVVEDMERPTSSPGVALVAMRVVEPAEVPDRPSSPGLALLLTIGLTVGVALGAGTALARQALDTSLRSPERLRKTVRAPNLATIPIDPDVRRSGLHSNRGSGSPFSEALRQLRTNLEFVDVDRPRRVVVVTSGTPGEGKTTTVAELGAKLAAAGRRVLLIDADLRRPTLASVLGLDHIVGLTDVLTNRLPFDRAVQQAGGANLEILASGAVPPNPSELLSSKAMAELLAAVRSRFDVVLIDTPPLLAVTDAAALTPAVDGVILVCRFRSATYPQIVESRQALDAVSADLLGTVITMSPLTARSSYTDYRPVERPAASVGAVTPGTRVSDTTPVLHSGNPVPPGASGPPPRPSPRART